MGRGMPGKRQRQRRFFGEAARGGILLSSPKEESRKVPPFRRGAAGQGHGIPSSITCSVMKNRGTSSLIAPAVAGTAPAAQTRDMIARAGNPWTPQYGKHLLIERRLLPGPPCGPGVKAFFASNKVLRHLPESECSRQQKDYSSASLARTLAIWSSTLALAGPP